MSEQHNMNEGCLFRFNTLEERVDYVEDKLDKRDDEIKTIEKAIVAIQVSSQQTAITLDRMDKRLDSKEAQKENFWTTTTGESMVKYAFIIIVLLIVSLLGANVVEMVDKIVK